MPTVSWTIEPLQDPFKSIYTSRIPRCKWLYDLVYKMWQITYSGSRRHCTCHSWKIIRKWPKQEVFDQKGYEKHIKENNDVLIAEITRLILEEIDADILRNGTTRQIRDAR